MLTFGDAPEDARELARTMYASGALPTIAAVADFLKCTVGSAAAAAQRDRWSALRAAYREEIATVHRNNAQARVASALASMSNGFAMLARVFEEVAAAAAEECDRTRFGEALALSKTLMEQLGPFYALTKERDATAAQSTAQDHQDQRAHEVAPALQHSSAQLLRALATSVVETWSTQRQDAMHTAAPTVVEAQVGGVRNG